ncbi:N-(5'-phosphoribosyl)anthranilate isomerase [Limihaloglobus sulfuriphilus]|uniref:N-(5'-phosphoribosyl)anthranilate isomerase n=1 Tax=Limihaloglobus sulfuriphilus TaxID=1851148 RepID=A0A1Q2MDJ3_9BACT|nr:phosphoribosylanthranilate isomerase [Limihaloglobus sulfuriphilus]AQQ70773.1 N-(5'-phosphoribosyl)anthranilate isomerase [Limihaloglobus sulfuriphilus]
MTGNSDKLFVKICGITHPRQAELTAAAGADAIGLVFYPPSPRNVDVSLARRIANAAAPVPCVGVFVNETPAKIIKTAQNLKLAAVQLHGNEPAEDAREIMGAGIKVIKFFRPDSLPLVDYPADVYLIEGSKGELPGGNGTVWNYHIPERFRKRAVLLAGGLGPDNLARACEAALPDGVDASSSLEIGPGIKDIKLVEKFINSAKNLKINVPLRRILI